MNATPETDQPDAPDQPDALARRQPSPAPLLTRPDFPQLVAAVREGRESFREIGTRFGVSASSVHRLSQQLAEHDARRAGQPVPEPEPRAPVPTLAEALAGCPLCSLDPVARAHADRALHERPHDLARTARYLRVTPDVAKKHLDHSTRPAALDPTPPPPKLARWAPSAPPAPLPETIEAAQRLLDQRGRAVVPAITAWANLEYSRFCNK